MTFRRYRLVPGHRVFIRGGKYKGKKATLLKVNRKRHRVDVDGVGEGWANRHHCLWIEPEWVAEADEYLMNRGDVGTRVMWEMDQEGILTFNNAGQAEFLRRLTHGLVQISGGE